MKLATRFLLASIPVLVLALSLGCGGSDNNNGSSGGVDPGTFQNLNIKAGIWDVTLTGTYSGNSICSQLPGMNQSFTDTVCDPNGEDFTDFGDGGLGSCSVTEASDHIDFTCTYADTAEPCITTTTISGTITVLSETHFKMTATSDIAVTGPAGECQNDFPCTINITVDATFGREYAGCAATAGILPEDLLPLARREALKLR
jgi:hypothetical protein